MCRPDSRLRKKQQDKRNDPVAQILQQRLPIETFKRQAVTRGEGDKRYTRPPDVTRIIDSYPSTHAPVTLAGGSDPALSLSGQELDLDLSGYATTGDLHSPVTISASLDAMLALSGQALDLDTQAANRVWAGPASGAAAKPTFRALVAADVPGAHDPVTLGAGSETALALSGQQLTLTAYSNPGATANRVLKTGTGGVLTLEQLRIGSSSGDSNFDSGVYVQVIDASLGVSRESQESTIDAYCYGTNIFASFRGRLAGGTRSSPSNVGANVEVTRFGGAGYANGFSGASLAYMSVVKSQSGTSKGHRLEFWTTTNGGANATLKATLANDGKFGVGGNHSPAATIDADGDIVTRNNGHLMADGGLRAGSTSSAQANCLILDNRSVAPSAESGALAIWYDDTAGVMKAKIPSGTVKTFTWT